ncbi:hypothetical protein CHCC15337_0840 [Bacillus paralicheniformis]|nr:hypothetical protein CHCC19468_4116 [Bacillus paralicheniformis]TWL20545.1 hypothetical protein CHCC19467_2877 [Bacillus paralicheniformis]TWL39829.1 hypothetical protein CHCC15337_0840 [Bacillus paralicheniformis]TWL56306.1 hypothetical protein CHCC15332_0050 [Bacillus paralicheniformis]TWN26963.1 hypothetical protein CHCC14527_2521 [Bacillus paralicheniformis]
MQLRKKVIHLDRQLLKLNCSKWLIYLAFPSWMKMGRYIFKLYHLRVNGK